MNASMVQIASKIKVCGEKLLDWSRQSFGSIRKQLESKGKQLSKAEINAAKGNLDYEVVKVLRANLNDLLDKESKMWQQRSRALFLKCGDRNTSFFHSKASHRCRRNRISGLKNSANSWCTENSEIKEIAFEYYRSLFTSSQPSYFSVIMEAVQPFVFEDMNTRLLRPFIKEEVEATIKEMKPITAPGPDGMPPLFYQSF